MLAQSVLDGYNVRVGSWSIVTDRSRYVFLRTVKPVPGNRGLWRAVK